MYPRTFFDLFPPFPRDDSVFVAMSFADQMQPQWRNVIRPAIEEDCKLKAIRVDHPKISDSILTDILKGISGCKVFLADLSSPSDRGPSPNVMYEVGIAHATRQPQEVVLFTSDKDRYPFDIANIRVNSFTPDVDESAARKTIVDALEAAIAETSRTKALYVERALDRLDVTQFYILFVLSKPSPINQIAENTGLSVDQLQSPLGLLMDHDLVRCENIPDLASLQRLIPSATYYKATPFGDAVTEAALWNPRSEMGIACVYNSVVQHGIGKYADFLRGLDSEYAGLSDVELIAKLEKWRNRARLEGTGGALGTEREKTIESKD